MPKAQYTADTGLIHPIRLSADDLAAQPTAHTTLALTSFVSAKVSRSTRAYGLRPRHFVLTREIVTTTAPILTITKRKILPILLPADYTTTTTTFTIGGVQWTLASRVAESER